MQFVSKCSKVSQQNFKNNDYKYFIILQLAASN